MNKHEKLPVEQLRAKVDPQFFPFDSTQGLQPPEMRVVGQERAIDAIRFGMKIKKKGYNLFIAGPSKAGLTFVAKTFIEEQAGNELSPPDWCYVYNFKEMDKPRAISLSAGRGRELQKEMSSLVKNLQEKIPEILSGHDYGVKDKEIHADFEQKRGKLIEELSMEANMNGFVLQFTQVGMAMMAAGADGQPLSQEQIQTLSEPELAELRTKGEYLQEKMKDTIKRVQQAETEFKQIHSRLEREIVLFVVGQLMESLNDRFIDEPQVLDYLSQVQEDILENLDDFKRGQEAAVQMPMQPPQGGQMPAPTQEMKLRKYEVNAFIDNSETKGAPVVIESNPAYPNLFGSIEKQAFFGALVTDHTLLKPGAMHKANGGYLMMKAIDLLRASVSYEAIQRALRDGEIKVEDMGEMYGFFGTRSLKPEAIPLKMKIILTGDPEIYQLLYSNDDRFRKQFKVKAHMDGQLDRKDQTVLEYARAIAYYCDVNDLMHLDRTGVARVIEYAMEQTDNQEKLTLELEDVGDLISEADLFASQEGKLLIGSSHIEEAINKRKYRASLYEEKIKEVIKKDIFWVETDGWKVGQVNGLSVLMTGDHVFGQPNRITASVSVGKEGTISIDRESKMSGTIHTKGLLTLSSFLKERFAQNKPIALTASLSFEQSYGMIDGDSASSTELYVLLSAIAGVPIYQGIAVTGSVSQKGEVQPIGGVNHKIKGFYDICKFKGLTGSQGVIIPSKNIKNLMLDSEVVDAVKEGKFNIWPVSTIEEGIEILTGMEAGVVLGDGSYPEGTIFRKIDDRLREIAQIVQNFGKESENGKKAVDDSATLPQPKS